MLLASSAALAQDDPSALAKTLYDDAMKDVFKAGVPAKVTGEDFCWRAGFYGGHFVKGYLAYGDKAFLENGLKFYDALMDAMALGLDGYKGFVGARPGSDVHVGDAVALEAPLAMAELILKDDALKAKYGEKASLYVEVARKDLVEKWDARGTWKEDGDIGGYVSGRRRDPNLAAAIGQVDANRPGAATRPAASRPGGAAGGPGLSIPFNKQGHVGLCLLHLYRITGDAKYRQKAEKIFTFQKSRMQFFDGHYLWNYFEPLGPWDIDLEKGLPRHWIGVHPYRDYQDSEVTQMVDAYHTGVVFDKTDIERILNLNLKVMWDGNKANPFFRNSNCTVPGYELPTPTGEYTRVAGTLWTALADFDQTVRDLAAVRLKDAKDEREVIDRAYLQKVTCKTLPSFDRKYAKGPVTVPAIECTECKGLIAAFATPLNFKAGEKTILLCKSPASGDLEIALYSADGKTKKGVLYTGKIEGSMDGLKGIVTQQWDGKDPATKEQLTGAWRIRWTFLGGYREKTVNIEK
jgi:hypothetical protein